MPRTKEAFRQIRDERKEQILHIAAVVFASKGIASTKIEDLAEAAGVSQGLLYRYFANKEGVFAELLERAAQGAVKLAQAALNYPGTPWERLRWMTEQFLQGMSQEPTYYQLISQALALSGRTHEILHEMEDMREALHQLVVEGQAVGQVSERDPDQLVLLYFCCLYGLAAGMALSSNELTAHFPDADAVIQILKP